MYRQPANVISQVRSERAEAIGGLQSTGEVLRTVAAQKDPRSLVKLVVPLLKGVWEVQLEKI